MARTKPQATVVRDSSGASGVYVEAALTNNATTTAVFSTEWYTSGCVMNESGGAVAITINTASTIDGTALGTLDSAGNAQAALTVADDKSHPLPDAVLGVPFFVPVSNTASATVTFFFKFAG